MQNTPEKNPDLFLSGGWQNFHDQDVWNCQTGARVWTLKGLNTEQKIEMKQLSCYAEKHMCCAYTFANAQKLFWYVAALLQIICIVSGVVTYLQDPFWPAR